MKYYAIVIGRQPGIYTSWPEAEQQVKGFPGGVFKSFPTREQAQAFIDNSTASRISTDTAPQTAPLPDKTLIYADGGYDMGRAGFGVVIITSTGDKYTAYGRVPNNIKQTNGVAELYAAYVALSLVNGPAILYSDSRYVIDSLSTRIHDWIANGWQGAANQELLAAIYQLMQGRILQFQYVPAHSGYQYNEETDQLATKGKNSMEQLVVMLNGQRVR